MSQMNEMMVGIMQWGGVVAILVSFLLWVLIVSVTLTIINFFRKHR